MHAWHPPRHRVRTCGHGGPHARAAGARSAVVREVAEVMAYADDGCLLKSVSCNITAIHHDYGAVYSYFYNV
jgi:hypothetical protein